MLGISTATALLAGSKIAKALAFALMVSASPQTAMAVGTPSPSQTAQTGDPAEAEKLDNAANLIGQALKQLGANDNPEVMKKVQDIVDDLVDDDEKGSEDLDEQ